MSRQTSVARVEQLADKVGQEQNIEIVDVELKGTGRNQLLRISIDQPGGVTHGDCERVSHALSSLLDAEDIFPGQYTLEVSSPGIERKLRKLNDFERFAGKKAKIVRRAGDSPQGSRLLEGTLAGTSGENILIDSVTGERVEVPFAEIDRANLKFEW